MALGVPTQRVLGSQGEFWRRYGGGDCIRRKAPLCPFQGISSKVLAPAPEHGPRRALTMPKLHPSYADIFTMHDRSGAPLPTVLVASGAPRPMAPGGRWLGSDWIAPGQ